MTFTRACMVRVRTQNFRAHQYRGVMYHKTFSHTLHYDWLIAVRCQMWDCGQRAWLRDVRTAKSDVRRLNVWSIGKQICEWNWKWQYNSCMDSRTVSCVFCGLWSRWAMSITYQSELIDSRQTAFFLGNSYQWHEIKSLNFCGLKMLYYIMYIKFCFL